MVRSQNTMSQSKISPVPYVPINSKTRILHCPGADQASRYALLFRKQLHVTACVMKVAIIIDCGRRFLAYLNAPGICFDAICDVALFHI